MWKQWKSIPYKWIMLKFNTFHLSSEFSVQMQSLIYKNGPNFLYCPNLFLSETITAMMFSYPINPIAPKIWIHSFFPLYITCHCQNHMQILHVSMKCSQAHKKWHLADVCVFITNSHITWQQDARGNCVLPTMTIGYG